MTKPKPMKPRSGDETVSHAILAGDSILEKLVHQMPPAKREFVLLLMAELGLPKDDPALPLLIALQYYVNILQDIPEAMQAAADAALKQALTTYAGIQARLSGTVQEIDAVRAKWLRDTQGLLDDVSGVFDAARRTAVQQYEADLLRVNALRLKAFAKEWRELQQDYAKDIRWQGMQISFGVGLAALIVCSGLAAWVGGSMQHPPSPIPAAARFTNLAGLRDNGLRMDHCFKDQENNGGKCTFWIVP
jgi:hypothetical protein